ncbi:MAG: hypothetical protein RJA07_555 [Bacteroidota bacterium]|jgi:glycosyltransferase involved in cell wall biosynthesis
MKKVVVLSYFFPPCTLTASYRIKSWADYFHENGIYPIIITRNWDTPILKLEDAVKASGTELKIEKFDTYEVHYLPYKSSLRDTIYEHYSETPLKYLSKFLTAAEIIASSFTNFLIPHKNLYNYTLQFLKQNKDVKCVITSGKPYDLFRFGYLLKNKIKMPWVADYRDPWNTLPAVVMKDHLPLRLYNKIKFVEKLWVGSATFFITVSTEIKNDIQNFTGTKGYEILNGFDENDYKNVVHKSTNPKKLLIVHNGSLPQVAKSEVFINGLIPLIEKYKNEIEIVCEYIGVDFTPPAADKIKNLSKGYEQNFICTNRIPKIDLLNKLAEADCFLMIGHDFKGYPTSKIFEYVALRKPVILSPSDNSSMEEILGNTKQLILGHTVAQTAIELEKIIQKKLQQQSIEVDIDLEAVDSYSRKNQTRKFADLIHQYFN